MPDDLSAALAEFRAVAAPLEGLLDEDRRRAEVAIAYPRLLNALDAVLAPHAPRTDRVFGSSCFTHRTTLSTMVPVPGCGDCVQDRQRDVCPECRYEYGDPVLFQDCRARSAVLAALTGEVKHDG